MLCFHWPIAVVSRNVVVNYDDCTSYAPRTLWHSQRLTTTLNFPLWVVPPQIYERDVVAPAQALYDEASTQKKKN